MGYHSYFIEILTRICHPDGGQCQVGSLTGAVASQRVTEALKGTLRLVGNQSSSAIAEECLTARPTSRAGTKVGNSDPAVSVWNGRGLTDKSYPGDNRLISPKSSHRRRGLAEFGSKGWAVRPLKRYASWVQNVVRQFGPYLLWALEI